MHSSTLAVTVISGTGGGRGGVDGLFCASVKNNAFFLQLLGSAPRGAQIQTVLRAFRSQHLEARRLPYRSQAPSVSNAAWSLQPSKRVHAVCFASARLSGRFAITKACNLQSRAARADLQIGVPVGANQAHGTGKRGCWGKSWKSTWGRPWVQKRDGFRETIQVAGRATFGAWWPSNSGVELQRSRRRSLVSTKPFAQTTLQFLAPTGAGHVQLCGPAASLQPSKSMRLCAFRPTCMAMCPFLPIGKIQICHCAFGRGASAILARLNGHCAPKLQEMCVLVARFVNRNKLCGKHRERRFLMVI